MGNIQNKKISTTNVPSSSSSSLSLSSSSSTLTRKTTTTPTIITSTITTSTVITTTVPTSSNLSSSTITTSLNNNKQQQQQQQQQKDKINKKNSTKVNDYIITKVQEQIPLSSSSTTTISTITNNNNNNNNSSIKYKHHQTGETGTTLTTSRSFTNFSQSRQNKPKNKSTIIIIKSKSLNDNKLTTVNNLSKTYWPIPYLELIFLPHFQINRKPIEDQYNLIHLLAKGAFGDVYKVIDPKSQKIFALKVLNKAQIINDVGVQQLKDEVDIQKICGHHPFIVQGLSYWQNHRKIYLLSDYVARGELFENIIHFSYELIQIYIAELALALDFLHNAGVIYRDLKPENILLDEHYHIQLIDFGLSKWLKIGGLTKTICGTLQYMAPEILKAQPYGHAVDWWSLGIVAYRMVTNEFPNTTQQLLKNDQIQLNLKKGDRIDDGGGETTTTESQTHEISNENFQQTQSSSSPLIVFPFDGSSTRIIIKPEHQTAVKDLICRLLEINPQKRIHSIFGLKRIALYMNFNFDNVQKKKMQLKDLIMKMNPVESQVIVESQNEL